MSLSAEKIPVTKVSDSRIHFGKWAMPVREGGSSVSYLQASATSRGSAVQFDIVPPSPGSSVLSRDMLWYNKVTYTINVAGPAPADAADLVTPGVFDAPRAFPLTSCVDTMSIQINNETITVNNWSDIGSILRRFNPRSAMYKLSNFCPWYPDQSSDYSTLTGTNRDVLSAAAVGDYDFTRGAYTKFYVTAATPTSATVVLESVEPMNLSPFMYGSQSPGIPYTQTLSLRFNISDFSRALSHNAIANTNLPFTSANVVADHNESILYYQSIALPVTESIPSTVALPHYRLLVNTTPRQNLASVRPVAGPVPAGTNFTSQVINYPCIPSRIFVFCAPVATSRTPSTPDFTAQFCGGLSVQWNSRTALMTSTRREQLYSQAVDAGLALPWEQFDGRFRIAADGDAPLVGGAGSVLCIRPGIDFDLQAGEVPGLAGSYQFQVSANFNNQSLTAYDMAMYVVAVLPGTLTLTSGYEARVEIGVISQEDVLNATEKVHPSGVLDTYGGGWWDSLKSMVSSPISAVSKIANVVAKAAPILETIKNHVGSGATSGGSAFSGGGAGTGGADFYGGAILSRKKLADRLR